MDSILNKYLAAWLSPQVCYQLCRMVASQQLIFAFSHRSAACGWQATKKVVDKLYGAGVRRFFIMGAPPLHDAPTMRVMAPSPAASDLGRLAAFGLQTSLDAQSQVLPFEDSHHHRSHALEVPEA